MKQSVGIVLTVALLVTGPLILCLVHHTEAGGRLEVSDIHGAAGLTPEELNALTDSIFEATAIPGRVPVLTNILGGEPSIPNIPGGIFGIPNIGGNPPVIPGIPSSIFGP
jgi:hypothetical protein